MTPDALLIALAERTIGLVPEGSALRFEGPKGAMTEPLMAALSQHKMLYIAVFKTVGKRQYDAAWETIADWIAAGPPGPVPPAVIAAGKKVGFAYGEREWPPAYEERLRMALRVRGLLAAFALPTVTTAVQEAPTVIAPERGEETAGAA